MPTFSESDLKFEFPINWRVRAFDDHRFYQAISGRGFKAVDFLVLHPNGKLWLMEVKNYIPRQDSRGVDFPITPPSPEQLTEQLIAKLADSQRILRVINRSYHRKWYYRFRLWCAQWWPFPQPDTDLWFWTEAAKRLKNGLGVPLLSLHTPEDNLDYRRSVILALELSAGEWKVIDGLGVLSE